jgi:two-component system cell cycle response regulator DivK
MTTKPLILVCDDNRAISQLLVFVLERSGYRAHAVASALDCVAAARRDRPDLILMDIMMPGMDGATASGLMKDVPELQGVSILLLSAMSRDQIQERMNDANVNGFLQKPFRMEDLLELVRNSLPLPEPLKQAV